MEIVSDSLSKQKEKCKKFAEKYGIPEEDIYAKAEEVLPEKFDKVCQYNFKKLKEINPDITYEDCKEEIEAKSVNEAKRQSLIRGRSFYKSQAARKLRIKEKGKSCFILMRFKDSDFEPRAYKVVTDFIEKNGEEAAKKKGCIDSEGNYVHTDLTTPFENRYGKKINKDNYQGSAIGFFEVTDNNGGTSYEPRFIRIGFTRNKFVPVGKPAKVVVNEGDNEGPLFRGKKTYFYNEGEPEVSNDILTLDLINHVNNLSNEFLDSDRLVNSYDDLMRVSEQQIDDEINYPYAGIVATCTSIGQRDDPDQDIPCQFEVYDDDGDVHTITVWVPVSHFKGMSIIEDQEGILLLTDMYYSKAGEVKYHLGGFLPFESEEVLQ
jgi:hypothetical protein